MVVSKIINGKEVLFVQVPEKAYDFKYNERWNEVWCKVDTPEGSGWQYYVGKSQTHKSPLPNGKYEIIGKASDLTEEQWKEIVPVVKVYFGDRYPCYSGEKSRGYKTATESGQSLLKSVSCLPSSTLIIIKQQSNGN